MDKKDLSRLAAILLSLTFMFMMATTAFAKDPILSPVASTYTASSDNANNNTSGISNNSTVDNSKTNTDGKTDTNGRTNDASHSRAKIIDTSPYSPDTGYSDNSMYAVIIALFSLFITIPVVFRKGKTVMNEKNSPNY